MPISDSFATRLGAILPDLLEKYPTPFHLYDLSGMLASHHELCAAFSEFAYKQYFAVKALPNPAVLRALLHAGSGLDCSSEVELRLATEVGASGEDIVFTSSNTAPAEYAGALASGALITLDDVRVMERVDTLPPIVTFRAGSREETPGSDLMGGATRSKFGVPRDRLVDAYRMALNRGAVRFGIHCMTLANELSLERAVDAAKDLIETARHLADQLSVDFEVINFGGGIGIPYRPGEMGFPFPRFARQITEALESAFGSRMPKIVTEYGRCITGPNGVLVCRVITRSRKGVEIAGVDASMSALMRPGIYGAYHHASLPLAAGRNTVLVTIAGSLCENMDRFAIDRAMPDPREGDIVLIHDTGAHGAAMGFTYNGRLRPAELLLTDENEVFEIRRHETYDDYTATVEWNPRPVLASR